MEGYRAAGYSLETVRAIASIAIKLLGATHGCATEGPVVGPKGASEPDLCGAFDRSDVGAVMMVAPELLANVVPPGLPIAGEVACT